jgi:hypothetical protein
MLAIALTDWKEPEAFRQTRESLPHLVTGVLAALKKTDDTPITRVLVKGILDTAAWRITVPEEKYKYDQRFISSGAKQLFEGFNRAVAANRDWAYQGKRKKWHGRRDPMTCVQHEHVKRRKHLVAELLEAEAKLEVVARILKSAQACVVSVDDHDKVSRHDKSLDGWKRYEQAGVGVWDRGKGRWFIKPPS